MHLTLPVNSELLKGTGVLLASPLPTMVKVKWLSRVQLFATPWTVAYQAPLFIEFSRQEYWSGLLFPFSRGPSQSRDQTWVSRIAR